MKLINTVVHYTIKTHIGNNRNFTGFLRVARRKPTYRKERFSINALPCSFRYKLDGFFRFGSIFIISCQLFSNKALSILLYTANST